MKALFTQYSNRWQQLPPRDRLALRLLTLFLAAALFWSLLWNPQREALIHAEQHLQEALQLQTDLLTLNASSNASSSHVNSQTMAGLIAATTAKANLAVERMDSEESGRLNLSLVGSLADLLKWLDEIETQNITLVSLQLEVSPQAIAQARLSFESH
ncbi:general secretion pathway protein M [Pseudomonas lurida]|jgi:general secretion pathway protein M|uniref:type II secretion system protein GspM n=1 Tax=Pseudomonas lurida TaxID=244566 RepID=UPI000BF75891|nr:type II secretion system protein GspM [Pseudomonas lurida]PFG25151.1 general secretion pathway protein M [Pseudomonas lurida]